ADGDEQPGAECLLERADAAREGGLRDLQDIRRGGVGAVVGYGDERLDLGEARPTARLLGALAWWWRRIDHLPSVGRLRGGGPQPCPGRRAPVRHNDGR